LGVQLAEPATERRLGLEGSLILEVVRGSGAADAGLRPTRRNRLGQIELGDIILAIDGTPIRSSADVPLALERRQPGETVKLRIRRGREESTLSVRLSAPR
jgi:S1-C subfamily serine protease